MATITLSSLKAFPTAMGAGSQVTGGRGGYVYHVTNLNDSGVGSLRYGCEDLTGPRTIVFDISGVIVTNSIIEMILNNSDITIAGQTAPRGGITLNNLGMQLAGGYNQVNQPCNNFIMRFIRFRAMKHVTANRPPTGYYDETPFIVNGSNGFILDRCSFGMSGDQHIGMQASYGVISDWTIQNTTFGLCDEGGVLGGSNDTSFSANSQRASFLRNLGVHVDHRFPNLGFHGVHDVINNISFNWAYRLVNVNAQAPQLNYTYNYLKTGSYTNYTNFVQDGNTVTNPLIYSRFNYHNVLNPDASGDETSLWRNFYNVNSSAPSQYFTSNQHTLNVNTEILQHSELLTTVLADVGANAYVDDNGARGTYLDSYDQSLIDDFKNNTSRDPQSKAWTLPTIPSNSRPSNFYNSSKSDNIPEFFWDAQNLTSDNQIKGTYTWGGNTIINDAGYTAFEMYLIYAARDDLKLEAVETVPTILLTNADLKAFPTAQGFGKDTVGGRGGPVIFVTNQNASGPGSLKQAMTQSGVRNVVFRTGGGPTVSDPNYSGVIDVNDPNITVFGQSAPGGGFQLYGAEVRISTSEIIIRDLRVRKNGAGNGSTSNADCFNFSVFTNDDPINNVILDHISASWGEDENIGIGSPSKDQILKNITIQNSIIGESSYNLLKYSGTSRLTVYNNLLTTGEERNIRSGWPNNFGDIDFEMVNNIVHGNRVNTQVSSGTKFTSIKNHYSKSSQSTMDRSYQIDVVAQNTNLGEQTGIHVDSQTSGYAYIVGNTTHDSKPVLDPEYTQYVENTPLQSSGVEALAIDELDLSDALTPHIGAGFGIRRDATDTRFINQFLAGNGSRATSGSASTPSAGTPYVDSNNNGLSDDYEAANGNPSQSDRPATAILSDGTIVDQTGITNYATQGYTHLEIFMADLAGDWDDFEREGTISNPPPPTTIPERIKRIKAQQSLFINT